MAKSVINRYLALVALTEMFGPGLGSATYVLFLKSYGLDLFQVNLVNVAFYVTLFICEIPTGAFADIFGRKPSFVVSCFLFSLSLSIYAFSQSFWGFVLAEIVGAIACTFSSGAFDAYLVDNLKHYGYSEPLAPIFSKAGVLGKISAMSGGLAGAFVAEWDLALPWFIGSIGMLVTAGYSTRVMREDYFVRQKLNWRGGWQVFTQTVKSGFRYSRNNRAIKFVLVIMALQYIVVTAPNMQWQVFFDNGGISKSVLGVLWVATLTFSMIGAALAPKLIQKLGGNERKALLAGEIMTGILVAIMGQFGNYGLAVALYLIHQIPRGMIMPIKSAYLNSNIESKERATILSFESIAHHFGGTIGLLLSGLLARSAGIPFTWLIFGLFLVIGTSLVAKNGRH